MHSSGIRAEVRFGFFLYLFCVCSLIDGANKLHFTQNKLCFFTLLFHIFLVYILNDFLYMYCLLPFPLFTQIYANYVRLGVQRVSLKCQLFIEGTCAVCMCVVFVAQLPEKRSQKNKTNQNQKTTSGTCDIHQSVEHTQKKKQSKQTRKSMKNNNNIN